MVVVGNAGAAADAAVVVAGSAEAAAAAGAGRRGGDASAASDAPRRGAVDTRRSPILPLHPQASNARRVGRREQGRDALGRALQ